MVEFEDKIIKSNTFLFIIIFFIIGFVISFIFLDHFYIFTVFIIAIIASIITKLLISKKSSLSHSKTKIKESKLILNVKFYDDKIITTKTKIKTGKKPKIKIKEISYQSIKKVEEYSGFFYIFLKGLKYFTVFKSDIKQGTVYELCDILKKNIGDRLK